MPSSQLPFSAPFSFSGSRYHRLLKQRTFMNMNPFRQVFILAMFLATLSLTAMAQVTDATLKLNVADEQSNSVSGASIEIMNEETGMKRVAVTDGNGQVTIAGLPSGGYLVSLKANGFKSY